jgi:type I restriction enzyme, S subunit
LNPWPMARLGDICDKITDGTHHSPTSGVTGQFKYITAKNIKPWGLDLSDITYIDADTHREIFSRCDVRKDDVLYVKDGATTGRVTLNPLEEEFSLLSSVAVLRPGAAIRPRYLLYALQAPHVHDRMLADVAGVAITRLTLRKLNDAEIPLAPLACQDRIVEKLEELLSDLDAGVAELKAAQKKLALYRQSLLKAAVEGALTADWRARRAARGESVETGADLLARILIERRARWEARQLAKFKEQCKTPPKGWHAKYPEPVQPDTSRLPTLPDGWVWASLDQLCEFITSGSRGWADYYSDRGAVFIRSQNINTDRLELQEVAFVRPPNNTEGARTRVKRCDLLLTITGANVGKAAQVDVELEEAYVSQHVALIRPIDHALTAYLHLFLTASTGGRGHLDREAYGAGKPGLNLQQVGAVIIPLPSNEEILALMQAVSIQLEAAKAQKVAIELSLEQATAQRKNLLKAAFSGQLVPQDPDDEPASELLARIRAERETRVSGSTTRRPRRTSHA